jgi:flavin reductase (DIM6/NTAB) family NADH-FMN oxidoreductase RutF
MTMSSFTSLTLTPTPLVTFNVRTPSRTLDAIASSRQFNVHILVGDKRGKAVADHFTQGNMDGKGLWGMKYEDDGTINGSPLLRDEGIMYVLRCRLFEEGVEGGLPQVRDHVMVVGEVLEVVGGEGEESLEFGLAYADRKYREVGDVIPGKQ